MTRMNYHGGRGVLITPELRSAACDFARRTTCMAAERRFGVSAVSIGKWMRAAGIPRRRACAPTLKESAIYAKEGA